MPFLPLVLALMTTATPTTPSSYDVKATLAWRADREKKLKGEDGWLTLVGLEWLSEGEQLAGSAPGSAVALPPPAPARAGVFTLKGKQVSFQPAEGASATVNGKPFAGGPLKADAEGDPDVLRFGSLKVFAIVRGDKVGLRMKDPEAQSRRAFHGLSAYDVSPAWRVEATWEATPGATLPVPNVLGQVEQLPSPGVAVFTIDGKTHRLRPVLEDPEGPLFFIFGDETNKTDTYGAGRFLYAELPKDGKVTLDFNKAVNPPCAFTSFATCPIPPKENRLALKVTAGERRYGNH